MKNLILTLLFFLITLPSCRQREMQNSSDSIESLARKVLRAVDQNDLNQLDQLRINRNEFEKYLWKEFPASRQDVPINFAWDNLNGKTIKGMTRAISDFGGQSFTLLDVDFENSVDRYASFKIYPSAVLHVVDRDGKERLLNFCGSVVERNGEFKFLSYRD
jgi:hypothetical protein